MRVNTILASCVASISPQRGAQAVAVLLGLLGLLVMGAWLSGSAALVQLLPGAAAMRFNTAALFLVVSVALTALVWQRRRAVIALGAAVALCAAATASQDLLGLDLGIDNLIVRDRSGIGPNPCGRMAINTAFCFSLTGLTLISLACRGRWWIQPFLEGMAGSTVAAIGLASALGYATGIEAAYGWGASVGMAIHTAVGFSLCGAVLVWLAVEHERAWSCFSPRWLPLPAAMLVLTITLVFWHALRHERVPVQNLHTVANAKLALGLLRALFFALLVYYYQKSRRQLHLVEQSAAALRNTERRFRAIFDQTFQFIGLMSTSGTLLEANRTALAFAGLTEDDVVNKPFWETPWWTHSPELQWKVRDAVARASRGEFIRFEATHPDRDGNLHVVDFSLKPVRDEQGRVVLLIPEGRDITDQKCAQEQLRASEQRFELAIRGSSDGIWDWDIQTGDVYYSDRYKQLLGYEEGEFPHRLESFNDHLHPDDAPSVWEAVQSHLKLGRPYNTLMRLRTKPGQWRWFRARGEAIRGADGMAYRMAGAVTDVTELKEAELELTRLARQDKLTELPNRALLMDRLEYAVAQAKLQHKYDFGFLFLDFDRFKFVNDTLGHEVGDELLKAIAGRLRVETAPADCLSRVAAGATAARLGGDEFVVLLQDQQPEQVLAFAERLLAALAEPYHLAGHEVHSTASIGVVLGDPDYQCAEDVVRDADAAMYAAKRAGKARCVVFDADMREAFRRRLRLENDLRGAVERGEMSLAYQPILSLTTGEIQSVEVLARWRHPSAGDISPAEFIPLAEESDLIHSLGDWVLASACQQMVQWQHDLGASAPAIISLNLSYKQFRNPGLLGKIKQALEKSGLEPGRLQFEIGECAFASDQCAANTVAQAIRELGIQLAIDEFGTGSASLTSVHRFPVDAIKVNRSMLANLETSKDSAALIHALAVLVKNLGVCMVADGVETFAQAAALQELGCGYAQGHFLARPLSAGEFEQFAPRHGGITCQAQGAMAFAHRWSNTMALNS